jgi:hypothetical protein
MGLIDICIDQYLWSLYERTPKVDTVKVEARARNAKPQAKAHKLSGQWRGE